ncbi:hypothetical protein Tco_0589615, partial [Tanacetum coccineum]
KTQKGSSSTKRSKLDRSYARGASAVQVTTGLDLGGRDKPIFPTMIVQAQEQVGEG